MKLSRLLFLLSVALAAAPAWGAYTYSRAITIKSYNGGTGGMVSGSNDLANFTVYLKLTDISAFKASQHIKNSVQWPVGSGNYVPADFTLGTNSACASPYKFDIESWDQTNGTIYVWVLINPLPHAADVTLYACYGDSATTTYQGGTAGQAWNSDYTHVLHFGNGSSLLVSDSTSNGNDGTNHGATAAGGQIGGAGR